MGWSYPRGILPSGIDAARSGGSKDDGLDRTQDRRSENRSWFDVPTTDSDRRPYFLDLAREQRRGVLRNMLVIVTSDHGEQLGEHGYFSDGKSLYAQEVRVPLLIIPPGGMTAGMSVRDPVSLRDLAATVAEVVDGKTAPFSRQVPGAVLEPRVLQPAAA
jgi:hypothetical protein